MASRPVQVLFIVILIALLLLPVGLFSSHAGSSARGVAVHPAAAGHLGVRAVGAIAPAQPPRTHAAENWWNITSLSTGFPAGRYIGNGVWDPLDQYTVAFGGVPSVGGRFGDSWAFSNGSWTQLSPTMAPSPRAGPALAWDAADGYAVLFGGNNGLGNALGDTWTFVHGQWTNVTPLASPPARWGASMTYDAADSEILMFGGLNYTNVVLSDTWVFTHGTWTQLAPTVHPGPLVLGAMTYDAADGYVLMFGGSVNDSNYGETNQCWRFSGGVWTQLTPGILPPAAIAEMLTYDGSTGTVLELGGGNVTNAPISGFWQFHAGVWTELSASTPAGARFGSVFVWQPNAGYLMLYSGLFEAGGNILTESTPSDTWAYAPLLNASAKSMPATVDLGQTVHLTSTVTGGVGPFSLGWAFGDGGHTTTSSATHLYAHAGNYTAFLNVTDAVGEVATVPLLVVVHVDPSVAIGLSIAHGSSGYLTHHNETFTGTGQGGSPPYTFAWNYGDGTTGAGNSTIHAFGTAGTFTVKLRLTDATGATANASANVNVTSSSPGGSGGGNSNGSSISSSTWLLYGIIGAVIVVVAALAAWALLRRRRRPPTSAPPPQYYPGPAAYPPAPASGPPAGPAPPAPPS
ncbi:MAG: PKD domain-containing protein [Thermoplasmata archaeon]|nr:PKD domain-containing protein [Thermoplasmata archaeon]